MPSNPDPINAPMGLVTEFRIASGLTMSIFWGLLGIILGAFWDRTKPHETAKIEMVLGVLPFFIISTLGASRALLGAIEGSAELTSYCRRMSQKGSNSSQIEEKNHPTN